MFNIFNTGNDRMFNKVPLYPNNNLDNILYSQLSTFKKYMYKESFFIDNKHPLVTLLNECYATSYIDMVEDEIAYLVKDISDSVGNTMGLTTYRNKGKVFKDGNLNYMIILDFDINLKNSYSKTEGPLSKYEVIKCIYTDYKIVDFSYNTTDSEFMILKVNPIELMLTYLTWIKYTPTMNSFNVFIASYILPKIWDTKLQHVLFNRFMGLYNNEPLPRYKNKLPISLINSEVNIDKEMLKHVKYIKGNMKIEIKSLLYGFKYVHKDMLEVLSFDERIFTNRDNYMLYLCRSKYVLFFLNMIFENNSKAINTEHISILYVIFRRINNGLISLPELPLNVTLEFRDNIEKIKELINYR